MCGIAGLFRPSGGMEDLDRMVIRMAETLRHRGPNDDGCWADPEVGIALAHRRLSILDLSPDAHQPMTSESGRYVISYNGEVYNFREIRKQLQELGHTFRGHSDTIAVLAAIEQWGLCRAVERFNGMFAFAVWDRQERLLHLVRDRLGIKPLFYGWVGEDFLFGSELKAITSHPKFQTSISRDALSLYLRYSYVPTPLSIYQGIYKLPPGVILSLQTPNSNPAFQAYWDPLEAAQQGLASPFPGSALAALEQLEDVLRDSVRLQMIADVPLGAFLSGGVDSSTVVALMQKESSHSVKTFSIGYQEDQFNEAIYAERVAKHLGTDHTELYLTSHDCMDVIPKLSTLYDEPFGDSSQIPTFLVSELAREQVTVCLSGDGGDELFGGYNRYFQARTLQDAIRKVPGPMRAVLGHPCAAIGMRNAGGLLDRTTRVLLGTLGRPRFERKARRLANIMGIHSRERMYQAMMSHWSEETPIVLGASEPMTTMTNPMAWGRNLGFMDWMMYIDMVTYLPDDILTKVDRASMGVSLESRVPLLDHRVVEFAWSLPQSMKFHNGHSKWALRQVLYKYVPAKLVERPKMGFGVPVAEWMRGPLREWAEALLDETRLRQEGYLNPKPVRERWERHLSGRADYGFQLWDVLMFQAWKEKWHG
jgi:asparagine synthase (glutamine-hydrolysing)